MKPRARAAAAPPFSLDHWFGMARTRGTAALFGL